MDKTNYNYEHASVFAKWLEKEETYKMNCRLYNDLYSDGIDDVMDSIYQEFKYFQWGEFTKYLIESYPESHPKSCLPGKKIIKNVGALKCSISLKKN